MKILISRENLLHNLRQYQENYPQILIAPVLKSNAYGHGIREVARIFDREKIAFFVVDSLYEALTLRRSGIRSKVLIMGYTSPQNIKKCRLRNVSFMIGDFEVLEALKDLKSKRKIHLKIDTGMHRQGVPTSLVEAAVNLIRAQKFLELEGVCSHFADADNSDSSFTRVQVQAWNEATRTLRENFPSIKYFHLANTAGVAQAENCNTARVGIGLYGIDTDPARRLSLRPALEMKSVIASLKFLEPGGVVGYGCTYKADHPIRIATVPVGYHEGVPLRLSNSGSFGAFPILGKVSMNITTIDVSCSPSVKVGDEVTVISNNPSHSNSIENIARLAGTSPYEILAHLPAHLRREVL